MLHSALVNAETWPGNEPASSTGSTSEANTTASLRAQIDRKAALAELDEAMRVLSATPAHANLVRRLNAAYSYFSSATAEWEIRAADMWNAALRAADAEIRAVALPRAGWSLDAQTSACTCALIIRGLVIGSARPRMTLEEQAQQVVLRG